MVLCWTVEKKNCLLLIRSRKICTFRTAIQKKSLIRKRNYSLQPGIRWSTPKLLTSACKMAACRNKSKLQIHSANSHRISNNINFELNGYFQ